ncbi:MAG: hypothetical protein ABI275_00300 [Terrimesophilobacter sp.]
MSVGIAALLAVMLVLPASVAANAATTASYSDEVGGTGVAVRANTSQLDSAWQNSVAANGGTAQAPAILPSGTITSLPVAADGTTTSVTRTRYSTASSPAYVAPSPNQGTASCVANGAGSANAGAGLQGNAPRPTALVGGGSSCPNGFSYNESGGAGESTTRDAIEFAFSRPILGFGAWFGDLETRTDGQGVAAVVRLYGIGDVLVSDQPIIPGPSYSPQSSCGDTFTGCGNNTTRWVGFVADPAQPILRMVVIVGDDDAGGDAANEGISFIGPTFDLSTASISMAKSAEPLTDTNADGLVGAGDTLSYSFVVKNTGTLPVSSVTITDVAAAGLSCPPGVLAPAASATCTGSHVVTQSETNAGSVTNTATATAAVYGGSIASTPSTNVTTIPRVSGLAIVKTVNLATYSTVGDVLSYNATVTNDSNVTVTAVTVSDRAPGMGAFATDCGAINATMQPHDTITCQASYTVTQSDLDTGPVANIASTTGTVPSGATIGPFSDTATSTAIQAASLGLTKSVAEPTFDAIGDLLHYTITASNAGNVTFHRLAVIDPNPGSGAFSNTCAVLPSALAPGATATCTATYAITQVDLNAGQVTNLANASADDPAGVAYHAPQDTATSTAVIVGALGITKSVAESTFNAVGDMLHYTLTVTNNANTSTSLVVTDANPGSGSFSTTCGSVASPLAPATSVQCTANYTVTQADLDHGSVTNSAHADGVAGGNSIHSPTAHAESTAIARQALALSKTPNVTAFAAVGDVIAYTLELTNQGNITLSSPQIVDNNPGAGVFSTDCGTIVGPIAPAGSVSCSVSYTVTQADVDAGSLKNTANAKAIAPNADVVTAPSAIVVTPAKQLISLTLAKSVTEPSFDVVGADLHYTLTLTNDGNTTLTAAKFADSAPGTGGYAGDCAAVTATLLPGASVSCSATYSATQADLDAGKVANHAQGSADDPAANPHPSNNATATSLAVQLPTLGLAKTAAETNYHVVGDMLHFTITLTNTGNVSFTNTTISDSSPGDGAFTTTCGTVVAALAPGASRVCHANYTITAADLAVDSSTNEASASAVAAGGAVLGAVNAQSNVARGSSALAMTGTSVTTLSLIALALLLSGGVAMTRRRGRPAHPPTTNSKGD